MNRRTLLSLFLVLFLLAGSQAALAQDLLHVIPEEVGVSSDRLERITAVLERYVADGRLPGAVAIVVRDGGVVYHEAFGHRDMEAGDPMTTDAIFRIASQSKAIVSVAIMILQEEGRLLINDEVGAYLPEFAETTVAVPNEEDGYDIVEADRAITIRDLLTHTAGVGYGNGPAAAEWEQAGIQGWYFADRDEPIRETVRRMAELPMDAHPGEKWVYGYNTDILGAVVEVVSGQPLDEFLEERIFEPLGMSETHFYLPPEKREHLAAVYSVTESGALERAPDPGHMVGQGAYVDGPRMSFSGGAGLLSTSTDYARFLLMLLYGGEWDGVRILAPSSVALMTVNQIGDIVFPGADPPGSMSMGLGFAIVEEPGARGRAGSVGAYGWGGAYHSTYWVDPAEGLVFVYFTQLIPARGLDDHAKFRALVYQALVD